MRCNFLKFTSDEFLLIFVYFRTGIRSTIEGNANQVGRSDEAKLTVNFPSLPGKIIISYLYNLINLILTERHCLIDFKFSFIKHKHLLNTILFYMAVFNVNTYIHL